MSINKMADRGKHVDKKTHFKAKNRDKNKDKFKKFIGNKAEGQGFADKRKRKIQYEYLKMLKKEKKKNPVSIPTPVDDENIATPERSSQRKHQQRQTHQFGKSTFSKAAKEAKTRQVLKKQKKDEAFRNKQEKETAMQSYHTKKKETFKKICKKTHKGQPVMKNQIEYLLQKIEKQRNQT